LDFFRQEKICSPLVENSAVFYTIKVITNKQKKAAIRMAIEGRTLQQIHEELGCTCEAFYRLRQRDPAFAATFAAARGEGLELIADSLLTITETEPDVYRARVKSENIRWILSKRKPTTYGDKIDINVTQTVDIGAALIEAKSRAVRSIGDQSQIIDAEVAEMPKEIAQRATDSKSVAVPISSTKRDDIGSSS
jgi:hypothetical protein